MYHFHFRMCDFPYIHVYLHIYYLVYQTHHAGMKPSLKFNDMENQICFIPLHTNIYSLRSTYSPMEGNWGIDFAT